MNIPTLHSWTLKYSNGLGRSSTAVALQERLCARLRKRTLSKRVRTVAGADVSYSWGSDDLYATVVVLALPELEVIEEVTVQATATFPYVPGLLSFREGPVVIKAFRKLKTIPDAVIFDGQGIAHPRGLGLAAHMGVWLNLPTAGCAKTRLVGTHSEPARKRGSRRPLTYNGVPVGTVLRTRADVKPVFVSPGQFMDIPGAVDLVLMTGQGRRMPEPTRRAHLAVNRVRRETEGLA